MKQGRIKRMGWVNGGAKGSACARFSSRGMHGRARGAQCGEAIRGGGLWAGRQIKNEPPARVRRGTGCASRGYGAWDRKRGTAEEGGGVRSRRRKIGGSWLAVSFVLFSGAWIAASAAVAHQRGRQVGGAGQRARRARSEQGWEEGGCVGEVRAPAATRCRGRRGRGRGRGGRRGRAARRPSSSRKAAGEV